MRPKLLLFDLDGVLAEYRRDVRCMHLGEAIGVSPVEVQRALFRHGHEDRSDRGEIDLPDYLDALRSDYGWSVPEDAFIAARGAATQVDRRMLMLCERLAGSTALGLFTNNGRWLIEHADRIVPELRTLFGRRWVCSGDLRLCKPDPNAYLACLSRLGFAASSTTFIDDRHDNIQGARAAGLDAIHFESVDALTAALRERNFELDPIPLHEP